MVSSSEGGQKSTGGGVVPSASSSTRVAKAKAKKRATACLNKQLAKLRAALFEEDGSDRDVTAPFAAFKAFDRNGVKCTIDFSPKLDSATAAWCFDKTKARMEGLYEASGYGWDDADKWRELTEDGARFLVARDPGGAMVAFAHFRFTVQGDVVDRMCGDAVLTIQDLQVGDAYQRRGLGKHMVSLLELVARVTNMTALSVPVVLADDDTQAFLQALRKGFAHDDSLEDLCNFDPDLEGFFVFTTIFMKDPESPPRNTSTRDPRKSPPRNTPTKKLAEAARPNSPDSVAALHGQIQGLSVAEVHACS